MTMEKKDCIAMLLAGGQGSRLHVLTRDMAKPAVGFGGKYRIIDFTLSNCVNSGIDTVGVLTQYQPLELNRYIGNGLPWDLDRLNGGVHILPPYQRSRGSEWYKGTANAIYQNLAFIEEYSPDNVVILSGDHIYKMNYAKMLEEHIKNEAACTIAVLEVPIDEANRFGIMNTEPDGRIYEFEEKPKNPKSNQASMGVYIFNFEKLKKYLVEDEADPKSSNDFGKDIIPKMLAAKERMYAYPFTGYWKDVGTIDSLWEANMDLLNPARPIDLSDPSWKIYFRNPVKPPHYISTNSVIQNSLVSEGCEIAGDLDFSVVFSGVTIEDGAQVFDSIVMSGATIRTGAQVQYAIIGENAEIGAASVVGFRPECMKCRDNWGVAVVGPGIKVGSGCTVAPKAIIDSDMKDGESR
ncbi:MAG TPA: glucose-1-phosphate adenylyltransferase [Oscillospiraceae bacterium]|nr:glucose-1-phosphate adenylyltransferase [Oscillospiraceae bacterium]HPK35398.1 glucose-1-phosphate adenylyltransferase [Oscillospiraceae bacterium]HPR75309.1 glucose-1-phosphate adenylyltransferase [Oscillospiraceae bacterium]